MRAAAGPGELGSIAKYEPAIKTGGWFEDEAASAIPRDRFDDMDEMLLDLSLGDAQHLCQLVGRESSVGQEFDDPLARGAFGREHRI